MTQLVVPAAGPRAARAARAASAITGRLPEYHQAVRRHPGRPRTRQQFLDAVLPNGLLFSLGDSWAYSNVGYMLVVDVLERVTGRTVAQVLAELVTEPLGLQQTSVLETVDDLRVCVPGFGTEVHEDGALVRRSRSLSPRRVRASRGGVHAGGDGTPRNYPGSFGGTAVFLGCSDIDPHIPLQRVHESAEVFRRMGGAVDERIYPRMGHTINRDELNAVDAIVGRIGAVDGPLRVAILHDFNA